MNKLNTILLAGLLALVIVGSGALAIRWSTMPDVATIGGQPVPGNLHCQEDEVIAYYGIVDTMTCRHTDAFGD